MKDDNLTIWVEQETLDVVSVLARHGYRVGRGRIFTLPIPKPEYELNAQTK